MNKLKALYMFVSKSADSTQHHAMIDLPTSEIWIHGVGSFAEGAEVAQRYVEQGIVLIELCGGFGYDGARQVSEAVGDRASVGVVLHQVWNASKLATALAGR